MIRVGTISVCGGGGGKTAETRDPDDQTANTRTEQTTQGNTHRFVFDGSSENRIVYEFTVKGQKIYI